MPRRVLLIAAAATAAAAVSLPSVTPARAHAQLVSSTPGAGEVVAEAPAELRLVFSEPVEAGFSSLDVLDQEGGLLAQGVGAPDPADPFSLVAPFPATESGTYTVNWRALSAADGHVTSGFLMFGVGDVAVTGAVGGARDEAGELHTGHDPPAATVDLLARTLSFGGLMLAFGLAVIGWVVLRPALAAISPAVWAGQGAALLAAAAGSGLGLGIGAGDVGGGAELQAYLLGSRTGQLLGLRILVALLGIAALLVLVRHGRAAVGSAAAGVSGLTGLGLVALGGHAAGYGGAAPVAADVVHLAAAGVWLSGLGSLAVVLVHGRDERSRLLEIVPRFSALALISIALVVATGAYAAWLATRDLAALGSPFGVNLAVKVAVVGAALGLGGLNYLDGGRDRATLGGLRRRVLVEASLAVLVVILAANLTSGSPPAGGRPIALEPAVSGVGSESGIALSMQPGRPGPNRVIVELADAHSGGAELVLRRLDTDLGSTRLPLRPDPAADGAANHQAHEPGHAAGRFVGDGVVLSAGSRWDASVVLLDPDGAEQERQRFSFAVGSAAITSGEATPPIDPRWLVPVGLLGLGLLALSYWLGGGTLPRTERGASGLALLSGGAISVGLGALILLAGMGA